MRFDWTVQIDGQDVSPLVVAGGTIDYGKATVATGFQSPVAVFELLTKDLNPNPAPPTWPAIHLGDPVIIHVTHDGTTQHRRFTGVVQALDYSLYGLRVTASGVSADWARAWAGGTGPLYPITTQNDTTRVNYLVTDAGKTITVEGAPARWVRAIPTNTLDTVLLDALLRVADDCDALLMEDRLGVMHYRTRNFTRPDRILLPAHLVESTSLDMVIERGALINSVAVYYGEPDPATGNQAYAYGIDNTSVAEYGEHRAELYTDLQYEVGAGGKAQRFLERNRLGWQVPDAALILNQATPEEADAILGLQENWRVALSPLPEGCPIGSFDGDVLGFTEVMHETDYRMILHLGMPVGDAAAPPEEPIFDAGSITGGTTSTYEDQFGFLWELHQFTTPGADTATCIKPVAVDALVVGAGAGGGGYSQASANRGGGGGAGGVLWQGLSLTPGTIATLVGAGGTAGAGTPNGTTAGTGGMGGNSSLAGLIARGGGGGGGSASSGSGVIPGGFGLDGGSGGGGGECANTTSAGGAGLPPQGHDGAGGGGTYAGGGGGAASAGSGATGGSPVAVEVTGTAVPYGRGGSGGSGAAAVNPGDGGGGAPSAGTSIVNGQPGANGVVAFRYRIG